MHWGALTRLEHVDVSRNRLACHVPLSLVNEKLLVCALIHLLSRRASPLSRCTCIFFTHTDARGRASHAVIAHDDAAAGSWANAGFFSCLPFVGTSLSWQIALQASITGLKVLRLEHNKLSGGVPDVVSRLQVTDIRSSHLSPHRPAAQLPAQIVEWCACPVPGSRAPQRQTCRKRGGEGRGGL